MSSEGDKQQQRVIYNNSNMLDAEECYGKNLDRGTEQRQNRVGWETTILNHMVREECMEKVLFRKMAHGYVGKSLGHANQRFPGRSMQSVL